MEPVTFANITVERCVACEGIWFDGTMARDLKKIKGGASVDTGSAKVGKEQGKMEGVDCPICGKAMVTRPDPYQPHIRYEVCPDADGVYFDAGEFRDYVTDSLGDVFKDVLASLRKKS
jgi:Zn-finger nucleic acid-binding protein